MRILNHKFIQPYHLQKKYVNKCSYHVNKCKKNSIPEAANRLKSARKTLETANNTISKVQSNFPTLSTKIRDLAKKLRTLEDEADISEIVQLLKKMMLMLNGNSLKSLLNLRNIEYFQSQIMELL